ncbi:MAG: M16 family metallopeptidase [Gemmataceae bacterium]
MFHTHTLPNGLRLIGEASPKARSAAVGFFVRTGSRDETADVCGVSHYLEHMAFKGSSRRSAFDVNRDFDRIGADYNAFTSEEATVYYASVLPEYLPTALDCVADLLRPVLRQDDFDMEKKVILEEISRYEDQPQSCAFDRAKQAHFGSHDLGNSILGTPESIAALQRDQMEAYYRRRYNAANVTMSVGGVYDWAEVVRLAEKYCGDWPGGDSTRLGLGETAGAGSVHVVTKPAVAQQYTVLMAAGPTAASPLRPAADLLGMAVGDDSGSRLYWELVDPGRVESAGCSFSEYDGAGVFYTSFSGEPDDTAENLGLTRKVLEEVQQGGITQEELDTARSKLMSRLVRSGERPRGRMMAIGMHWLYLGTYRSVDDDLKAYEAVTLAQVREVLDRYPLTRTTTLTLGPLTALA